MVSNSLAISCCCLLAWSVAGAQVPIDSQQECDDEDCGAVEFLQHDFKVGDSAMFLGAGGCQDLPNWKDKDGDTCTAIVNNEQCSFADNGDNEYWAAYGGGGGKAGAKQACCGCGGGMRTATGQSQKCIDYSTELNDNYRTQGIVNSGHCFENTHSRGKQFQNNVPKGKMLFYGDSDIEYWKSEDNFPDAINCGVGGSTAYEAAMHAQKTANKFLPKGHVVMVAGENDMKSALECPDTIFKNLKKAALAFANSRYHPTVIMFSTKPEPGTTELHSLYKKYDNLCKDFAATLEMKGHFKFVDAHSLFLELGNSGLYDSDNLHMNQVGYGHWNTWLKEVIKDGCHDQLGTDGKAWKDSGGDHCQSISDADWCSSYDAYKVDDVGANQACCACGGGSDDIPNWKDSDGDDCTKVVKGGHCQFADDFKVNGVGAKEACVGCGGGVKRHPLIS